MTGMTIWAKTNPDAKRYRQNCIGNMTYQEAADLAGEIDPQMVIPGHWDMFADNRPIVTFSFYIMKAGIIVYSRTCKYL